MASKSKKMDRADKVAAWRLCMGCGACKWACSNDAISLKDIVDIGIRPFVEESKCERCGKCIEVCPGIKLEHDQFPEGVDQELKQSWGPILALYEGFASDEEIRFSGSSGGIATALALYAVEKAGFSGVLHIKADPDNPLQNIPTFSTCREELQQTTGSRYAPASPCQAFNLIKHAAGPCMFIGKPCDVAALRKAQKMDADLDAKVGVAVSIFCAGTPTTQGTLAVLKAMGVENESEVKSFNYRGNGWPGMTKAQLINSDKKYELTYEEAWGGILSKYGQLRCHLCPDPTGEFADISCGDPWYRKVTPDETGRSLVIARTAQGKGFLRSTIEAGFASLELVSSDVLPKSQKSVLQRRRQLWGRILIMKLFCIPVPDHKGFNLKNNWVRQEIKEKNRAILSTVKRIIMRGWRKPLNIK
jgi:coenzyme F420 hydrogenase subunit beta